MTVRPCSARGEAEAAVGRDEAAHFEHDLCVRFEPHGARVATPTDAPDVDRDGAVEREQSIGAERLAPNAKEAAQRLPALVVDDATRVERPDVGATVGRDDAPEAPLRAVEPDRSWDDRNPAACEELEVNAPTLLQGRRPADEARGWRTRRRPVAGAGSHRCRHEPQHCDGQPDREVPRPHRRQATRAILCLLAVALALGIVAPAAKADGDPASDYLVSQQVFLSYDAKIPTELQTKLLAAVASANRNGFPVRVALIWSSYDLGSVAGLFGKPRSYARFLDIEDSKCWWGGKCGAGRFKTTTRLIVVMPQGLGFAQWKHKPAAGYRTLAGIKVTHTPAGLAMAATTAVVRLASAAGVKVSTSGGPPAPTGGDSGNNRIEILLAVVGALLLGASARFLIRRRAARSAVR
jgi:hypothetical protein